MADASFTPLPSSRTNTVTWIHIGDTHLTRVGEQNEVDLQNIIAEINRVYAQGVNFVFVPGDIADDGSVTAYGVFRRHLDTLNLPWCAIVGDHDVHEKSFKNFQDFVATELYSAFSVGQYRFLRLNAFSTPKPDAFDVSNEQLRWVERELQACDDAGGQAVLFLHCYPSDLKHGGKELAALLKRFPVVLVDMGHTHYNEISNDGTVLYTATRSTGQIEEGPVGYSVTTISGRSLSWHFVPLGKPSLVSITRPCDRRLLTERIGSEPNAGTLHVEAKAWSRSRIVSVMAQLGNRSVDLQSRDGMLWHGDIQLDTEAQGFLDLRVLAQAEGSSRQLTDTVSVALGAQPEIERQAVDQDNTIGPWAERGLLGTQLGPNKNGRKW